MNIKKGDVVRVVREGEFEKGTIGLKGLVVKDDARGYHTLEVHFIGDSNIEDNYDYFTENDLELVEDDNLERTFEIGDVVKIVGIDRWYASHMAEYIYNVGEIIKYDNKDNGYLVEFEDGETYWYEGKSIELVNVADKFKVGDVVKVLGPAEFDKNTEGYIGVVDGFIECDSNPIVVRFSEKYRVVGNVDYYNAEDLELSDAEIEEDEFEFKVGHRVIYFDELGTIVDYESRGDSPTYYTVAFSDGTKLSGTADSLELYANLEPEFPRGSDVRIEKLDYLSTDYMEKFLGETGTVVYYDSRDCTYLVDFGQESFFFYDTSLTDEIEDNTNHDDMPEILAGYMVEYYSNFEGNQCGIVNYINTDELGLRSKDDWLTVDYLLDNYEVLKIYGRAHTVNLLDLDNRNRLLLWERGDC